MPKPEHVAALAQLVTHALVASPTAPKAAEVLYAAIATNPSVQEAVLAALVEGGLLVEEFGLFGLGNPTMEGAQRIRLGSPDSLERALHYQRVLPRPTTVEVRLVEPKWREVGT